MNAIRMTVVDCSSAAAQLRCTPTGHSSRGSGAPCFSRAVSSRDTRSSRCASTSTPGAAFGRHTHPGDELAYVLEGSLEYEVEGKLPIRLNAGDVLFIPVGTLHAARNVGSGKAKEFATYVVEEGKPLVVMAK